MTTLLRKKDVLAGSFFIGLGIVGLLLSSRYPFGTASRMGPGYVPSLFAGGMIICGALILIRGVISRLEQDALSVNMSVMRPFLFILAAIAVFGLLVKPLGLIITCIVLVICSGFAVKGQNIVHLLILSIGLTAFVVLVMVWGIGVRIDLLPAGMVRP